MLHTLRQRRVRATWLPLLLVAVFVRALLPQGFMPTVHDGLPGLQICGPAALLLADGADGTGSQDDHAGSICPFAQAATPAPPPVLGTPLALAPPLDSLPLPPAARTGAATPSDAHRPRGPPTPA